MRVVAQGLLGLRDRHVVLLVAGDHLLLLELFLRGLVKPGAAAVCVCQVLVVDSRWRVHAWVYDLHDVVVHEGFGCAIALVLLRLD